MKRISIFLIMVALIVEMVGCGGGGYTPPSQNLEIRTWYDLNAVSNNLAGNHTLMNDIDSTTPGYEELASPTANGGKGWQPIGTSVYLFTGTFDGQGYEIRDLFINRPDEGDAGLFGLVGKEGVIKNIGVVNVTAIGEDGVGGLVGGNRGIVINSYSTGNVTGYKYVGGLVGENQYASTVSDSYSSANVNGDEDIGGLVGYNYYGTVGNSHSSGSVTGYSAVGGLVGENQYYSAVSDSYSSANVNGHEYVGGLVGEDKYSTVSNSYCSGSVIGYLAVGGLVGRNLLISTVSDSYSSANVNGGQYVGGLVGQNWGTVSNSYCSGSVTGGSPVGGLVGANEISGSVITSVWDTETSGLEESDGGTGKSTTEMQNIVTFSEAGWSITAVGSFAERNPAYIWNIVDDKAYPFLNWQSVV
ncbi:MAG: GLUG motif-containing protein [Dehalococcoidia bacterium]